MRKRHSLSRNKDHIAHTTHKPNTFKQLQATHHFILFRWAGHLTLLLLLLVPTLTYAGWAKVSGRLKQVSVGADGTVWGVNGANDIYKYLGNNSWKKIPGKLAQISVGNKHHIWGVTSNHEIYRRKGNGWKKISGKLQQISVGSDGTVRGVNSVNDIYEYLGNNSWKKIPGKLAQISVAHKHHIWGVNKNQDTFAWNGKGWLPIKGRKFKQVSTGANNKVWGLNGANEIFRLVANNRWQKLSGKLHRLSVGSSAHIWGVTSNHFIYLWRSAGTASCTRLIRIPAGMKRISTPGKLPGFKLVPTYKTQRIPVAHGQYLCTGKLFRCLNGQFIAQNRTCNCSSNGATSCNNKTFRMNRCVNFNWVATSTQCNKPCPKAIRLPAGFKWVRVRTRFGTRLKKVATYRTRYIQFPHGQNVCDGRLSKCVNGRFVSQNRTCSCSSNGATSCHTSSFRIQRCVNYNWVATRAKCNLNGIKTHNKTRSWCDESKMGMSMAHTAYTAANQKQGRLKYGLTYTKHWDNGNQHAFLAMSYVAGQQVCHYAFRGFKNDPNLGMISKIHKSRDCWSAEGSMGHCITEGYTRYIKLNTQIRRDILTRLITGGCKGGLRLSGHSMGGVLATLMAVELYKYNPAFFNKNYMRLMTYGSPRVFTSATAKRWHPHIWNLRWVYKENNNVDPVAAYPRFNSGFRHMGTQIEVHEKWFIKYIGPRKFHNRGGGDGNVNTSGLLNIHKPGRYTKSVKHCSGI